MKYYDLNIKKILEKWSISDALREIIANAIDESTIRGIQLPRIYKENKKWIIRDFGNGILIANFSQNENREKIKSKNVIGKFGIGLKDAIAVLFRNNIKFAIETRTFIAKPILRFKSDFNEKTIHMEIEPSRNNIMGTKFIFENVSDDDIKSAKSNFLIFQNSKVMFENEFGQIIKTSGIANIYIHGMKVSVDEDYTFSYNIIKVGKKLSSKMNRERKSIGRDAYSDTIEKIIASPQIPNEVIDILIENEETSGEMTKKKIRKIVYSRINESENYVFVTQSEFEEMSEAQKESIRALGKKIINIKNVDRDLRDNLYNLDDAFKEYNDSFNFDEVLDLELTIQEKNNLQKAKKILLILDNLKEIVIVKKNNILNHDV